MKVILRQDFETLGKNRRSRRREGRLRTELPSSEEHRIPGNDKQPARPGRRKEAARTAGTETI